MALEWIRHNRGYASTKCGLFQMSMAQTKLGPKYSVFAATTEPLNPLECIGTYRDPEQAKSACENHLTKQGSKK